MPSLFLENKTTSMVLGTGSKTNYAQSNHSLQVRLYFTSLLLALTNYTNPTHTFHTLPPLPPQAAILKLWYFKQVNDFHRDSVPIPPPLARDQAGAPNIQNPTRY